MTERKIGLAAFFNLVSASRGISLGPHHYPIVAGLEDQRIKQMLTMIAPGAGKSILLSQLYPLWELGHDPSLTTLSISAGESLPKSFMSSMMQIIQHDPKWRELFPDVRPSPDLGWSIERGLFVTGHHPADPDASYKAFGLSSKMLTGAHARLHVYDDIHDEENAATPEQREAVKRKYYSLLEGRADPRGVRRIAVGRWWAKDDVYQEWIDSGDWVVLQLPAARPGEVRLWYDVFVPRGLECVFTETGELSPQQDPESGYVRYRAYFAAVDPQRQGFYWPSMPSKRQEYERVARRQPYVAQVGYRGEMDGGEGSVFREDDFAPFTPPAGVDDGIGGEGVQLFCRNHRGDVEQAWDTALGQPQSESLTVALTGLLVPCSSWHRGEDPALVGPCDFHYDVYLLDLMAESVDFRQLAMRLRTQFGKWHPRRVTVEEKQSGVGLLQVFRGTHVPVKGQKVVQGKLERAVGPVLRGEDGLPIPGGAASVQGWARLGRVLVPSGPEWVAPFLKKVCAFRGGTRATDEFDALVHLVTRAIVRSGRRVSVGSADGRGQPTDEEIAAREDPRRQTLDALAAVSSLPTVNPWEGFCGAPCVNFNVIENREWCSFHGRPTNAIGSCGDFSVKERAA